MSDARRMTYSQALFQRGAYQQAYERARDELGKLRAVKVAAEAVADRLETRGTVYAADAVTAMLRLALGRGPDPMTEDK